MAWATTYGFSDLKAGLQPLQSYWDSIVRLRFLGLSLGQLQALSQAIHIISYKILIRSTCAVGSHSVMLSRVVRFNVIANNNEL
jgi:hypothetical protein